MKFPPHNLEEGSRVTLNSTGERATFTGTRREVEGVDFDFFTFDNGNTYFFYPSEVNEKFTRID